jgi:PAS domain S-box-containing protein/putative nucleotidyltransferase with HDIG domain
LIKKTKKIVDFVADRGKKINKDLYRDLVENTDDPIQTIAPDGRFLYVNRAWSKTLGYKREEMENLNLLDIVHPDSITHFSALLKSLLSGRRPVKGEAGLITKSGQKMVVEVSAHTEFIDGKPAYIQCILRDVSERTLIEKALRESEKKYVDLYQNAPDGYHSIGPDGTILEVNDTWVRMLGYERKEVIRRMKITDIIEDRGQQIFRETFADLKKNGSSEHVEYSLRKKDGSLLPVLINATVIYDEKGNFLQSRTIVRDISTRVDYRNRLRQALSEWRITFDSMPYGVLLIDKDLNTMRVNQYIQTLYGMPFEHIVGKKYYELVYHNNGPIDDCPLIGSIDNCCTKTFEYYDVTLKRFFMLQATPVPGKEGLVKSSVLALVDITEIKDKEKRLTDSRDAFFNMLKELDFSYRELKGLFEGLVHSFVNAIDAKSPWTKGHSERVTNYAVAVAKEMGVDNEDIETLRIASLLHDIGKIGTYDVILDKPKSLSHEEFNLINLHPVRGEEILRPIKQLEHLLPVIRHHHERIDGMGYPDGLKGEEIPLLSRILCVADSYDSMTSDRPYRPAGVQGYAVAELKRCSGSQFDAVAVEAFLRVLERK